ncbi:MAG: transposase [Candidatus Aminicenantales bacterium]
MGKYMIRPLLSLDEREGRVGYRYGKDREEVERMDYLEFIAWVTSHIPDKGQVSVRYDGLYANAHRGKIRKANLGDPRRFWLVHDCQAPVGYLQLNLTRGEFLIYHPQRRDKAKLEVEISSGQRSRKGISYSPNPIQG